MPPEKIELLLQNFRTNCICGSDMIRLGDSERQDIKGFVSLIQRKAITDYYFLNEKNKKNTAFFLLRNVLQTVRRIPQKNLRSSGDRALNIISGILMTPNTLILKNFLYIFDRLFKGVCVILKKLSWIVIQQPILKKNSSFAHFKSN
jgi:hypothetical protein